MKICKLSLVLFAALAMLGACDKGGEEGGSPAIKLDQTGTYDFPSETSSDYAAKTPLTVTVTNTGKAATGKLSISIDGAAGTRFNLSKTSIETIAAGGSDTFTVVPVQGLDEGDYQANVHVSGKGVTEQSFSVRFVVTTVTVDEIRIKSLPTQTVYGVGEAINVAGMEVVTVSGGAETPLNDIQQYLKSSEFPLDEYYFPTPGEKTIQIVVGSAPAQEFTVTVQSLRDRIAAAAGTTATIIIYGDETVASVGEEDSPTTTIVIDAANTNITLTTLEGSTKERVITKGFTTNILNIKGAAGGVALTLDGYVTLKGMATSEYGGTSDANSTNPLIRVSGGALLEFKGNSKLTGNVVVKTSGNYTDGAAIRITGANTKVVFGGNSQLTKCGFVNTGAGNIYGGAIYASSDNDSTVTPCSLTLKDNAKVSECFIQAVGSSLGGAIGGEVYFKFYMEGGEISGNYVKTTEGNANGGALCFINQSARAYLSGGVIKDNYLIYPAGKATRGAAIIAGSAASLTLSGSISIPGGSPDIVDDGGLKKDTSNSLGMACVGTSGATGVAPVNIMGTLSASFKAIIDICLDTSNVPGGLSDLTADTRVLRKAAIEVVEGAETTVYYDFAGDAPADKFSVRQYASYRANTVTDISSKTINSNGFMVTAQ
jgi:hypothetical protein